MAITLKDLKLGDIVFEVNSLNGVDHIAIVTRVEGEDCYISHAVSEPHNAVVETLLRQRDNECHHVFRHKNAELAEAAAKRALHWTTYRVPYDDKRFDSMAALEDSKEFCHPEKGQKKLLQHLRERYQPTFFRIVKYAARRNMAPVRPKTEQQRGLICTSFVALAYQVAELSPYVKTCDELGITWVSDKYVGTALLSQIEASKAYHAYCQQIHDTHEYEAIEQEKQQHQDLPTWFPSIVAWKEPEPIESFAQCFKSCFPLDAKIAPPAALLLCCQQVNDQWDDLGALDLPQRTFSEKERMAWRQKVEADCNTAREIQREIGERCSTPSPLISQHSPLAPLARVLRVPTP